MPSRGWIRILWKELEAWTEAGLVSPTQREQLRSRYGGQHEYNRLVSSILVLGAILIGLGLILFIASNWQALERPAKVGIVVAVILSFNAAGYALSVGSGRYPKTGDALLLIGAIAYGAGIWLMAQIFQLPYNHADSVLGWLLGLLPVVWLMRTGLVLVLISLLAPVWLIVLMANPSHSSVLSYLFLDDPGRSALYRYLPLLAVVVALVYRERHRTALILTLLGSVIWLSHFLWVQLARHDVTSLNAQLIYCALYNAYGLFLYGLGVQHRRHARFTSFATIYQLFAVLFLFVGNFPLTFAHHSTEALPALTIPPGGLLIYVGFVAAALLVGRSLASTEPDARREATLILSMLVLQLIGMHLGPLGTTLVSAWFNLLLIGELLAFLYLGYLLREEQVFRLALYGFAVVILARYSDTFWKLLPRSLFFLIGGILLIGGGIYMERQRKALTHKMRQGP